MAIKERTANDDNYTEQSTQHTDFYDEYHISASFG
jgi:hypothetical protein